jgi:phosphatidylserine/phosphatidylglycerophosphate/cardiolipin synthase-like enzyme
MNDIFLELPPHVRDRLSLALEAGLISLGMTEAGLRASLGAGLPFSAIKTGLLGFRDMGINEPAAAQWIRSVDKILGRSKKPDLVWSGPAVPNLHARNTREVYEELMGSASFSLWASSYAFFDGPRAFEILARRMDEVPELQATLLLNIQRRKTETDSADHLVRRFADRFWGNDWPGKRRPRVWYDPRALDPDRPSGVLHAKAVICDGAIVFMTSANLTEAAWDRNIELGLLHRDPALAASVLAHYQALIDQGHLLPLPLT